MHPHLFSPSNVPNLLTHVNSPKVPNVLVNITQLEITNVVGYVPPPKVPNQRNWYALHLMSLMSSLTHTPQDP